MVGVFSMSDWRRPGFEMPVGHCSSDQFRQRSQRVESIKRPFAIGTKVIETG